MFSLGLVFYFLSKRDPVISSLLNYCQIIFTNEFRVKKETGKARETHIISKKDTVLLLILCVSDFN